MVTGSKHQEAITIIKIFIPKYGAPKDMKQKLIEMKVDRHFNNNN